MKINNFKYENADKDGDIRVEGEVTIENNSDFDIELVKGSVIIVNENNVTVAGTDIDDDGVFIAAKDSGDIDPFGWMNLYKQHFGSGTGSDAKAYISVTTYRREFVKIGSLDVPAKAGDLTEIKKVVSLGGAAECIGVSCLRKKDTDQGEMDLNIQAGIRNTSDDYIARAQVTVKAMDQRDAQVDDNVDYEAIPAKSGHTFEPSFWGLKPGKMKNGSFSITASVFLPVESFSLEAEPTLSDD
jgi:hypothetical protein